MVEHIDTARIVDTVNALEPYLVDTLIAFVSAESVSGAEQPAAVFFEAALADLGLAAQRIMLDNSVLTDSPLYATPRTPDNGRHSVLGVHVPRVRRRRSVLFNGHLDVVPTGPAAMWSRPPFQAALADGWVYGRGSGDMKAGIVCALAAYKAITELGFDPAGVVGFNAVVNEEDGGNGSLSTVHALQNGLLETQMAEFDTVVIPEPFDEALVKAQVGVFWAFVDIIGRPAHAAFGGAGLNPIEGAMAIVADLQELEDEWNEPQNRHPAYRDHAHPINFNVGTIEGGEWNSSVPCTCTVGLRLSFYPDMAPAEAKAVFEDRIRATAARVSADLAVSVRYEGQYAPGCELDLTAVPMQALSRAHEAVTGSPPEELACTATTDARHFRLLADLPTTCYGPIARNIHGINESVSVASMKHVAAAMAVFITEWCGVVRREEGMEGLATV